jgi:hypothetical protein
MQLPCVSSSNTSDFSCILTLVCCAGLAGFHCSVSAYHRRCRHSFIVPAVAVTLRGQVSRTSSTSDLIDFAISCELCLGRAQTLLRACGTRGLIACVQGVCLAHFLSVRPAASTVSTSSFVNLQAFLSTSCRWCPSVLVRLVPYCM